MQFTNVNTLSVSLFIIVILFLAYIFYVFLKNQLNINKKYPGIAKKKYFYIKYIFLLLSFLVLFFSIFGVKFSSNEKNKANSVDIVFVLDVSKSMNVADISDGNYLYTRLGFAKKAIGNFISKNKGNRFSLVIFSGEAISSVPLTFDIDVFLTLLENVDYKNLTKQGSNFREALKLAHNRFYDSDDKAKTMIFISDGADDDTSLDFKDIYRKDIVYFVAGIGTEKGGKIITGRSPFGDIKYQKYNGEYVISKLNENNLRSLANSLNSNYKKLSNFSDLDSFDSEIKKLEKKSIEVYNFSDLLDFSRILSFISFVFFMLFLGFYLFEKK